MHFGIPHKSDGGTRRRSNALHLVGAVPAVLQRRRRRRAAAHQRVYSAQWTWLSAPPHWPDYYTFPAARSFWLPANVQPIAYLFPGSPTTAAPTSAAFPAPAPTARTPLLPNDYRDARWDTANIVKLQYQKNFGSSAYLRVFGYTFYSNTNRSGASRRGIGSGYGAMNYDYEVDGHTRGIQADFGDQLSSTNQLTANVNYITSTTLRDQ